MPPEATHPPAQPRRGHRGHGIDHLTPPPLLRPHQPGSQGPAPGPLYLPRPPLRVLFPPDDTWSPAGLCHLVTPEGPSCPVETVPTPAPSTPSSASTTTQQITYSLICLCAVFPTRKSVLGPAGQLALTTGWLNEDRGMSRPDQPGALVLPQERKFQPWTFPGCQLGHLAAAALPKTDRGGSAQNRHPEAPEAGARQEARAAPDSRCLTESQSVPLTWSPATHPIVSSTSAAHETPPGRGAVWAGVGASVGASVGQRGNQCGPAWEPAWGPAWEPAREPTCCRRGERQGGSLAIPAPDGT